jgi:hypothetical protein
MSTETPRRVERHAVQFPIRCVPASTGLAPSQAGWTRNLSEAGAALELNERLPVATRLQVWLFTERGSLIVEGQVVWESPASEEAGGVLHGVAFTTLAAEQVEGLRRLASPEKEGRRAGPRLVLQRPITCQLQGEHAETVTGEIENVSRGGLLLRLALALSPGSSVAFSLSSPQGAITGTGEIDWVDPPAETAPGGPIRHGIRFTAMGWAHAWALALLVTDPHEVSRPSNAGTP